MYIIRELFVSILYMYTLVWYMVWVFLDTAN